MIEPEPLQQTDRTFVLFRGRKLIYFAGCDYFRMSSHPGVRRALERTVRRAGLNVAASRLTTGNHLLYQQLESAIEKFFSVSSATLVQAGYMANIVAAQAMAGQFSHALLDATAHPALRDAAQFLNCPVLEFPSRSVSGLASALGRCGAGCRPLLMTDGMFSRDGSVAPLQDYLRMLPPDAMLMVDDAHGAGVIGKNGRGAVEYYRIDRRRVVQTITLSKAFGVYGGAILGPKSLRCGILDKSLMFVGSTPLPLPLAGAALASIEYASKHPGLRTRLHQNAERVRKPLRARGFDVPNTPGPVFALAARTPTVAKRMSTALLRAGIYPSFTRYPGGPVGGMFRFVISSRHTASQLDCLARVFEPFSPNDLLRP